MLCLLVYFPLEQNSMASRGIFVLLEKIFNLTLQAINKLKDMTTKYSYQNHEDDDD